MNVKSVPVKDEQDSEGDLCPRKNDCWIRFELHGQQCGTSPRLMGLTVIAPTAECSGQSSDPPPQLERRTISEPHVEWTLLLDDL